MKWHPAIPRLLFGLKWRRFSEWKEVLKEEGRFMTWRDWLHMAGQAYTAFTRPVNKDLYRHRLYVCQRCPIYDKSLKRCRPYTGSDLGCGCYAPYKAKAADACWLKHRRPDLGWD